MEQYLECVFRGELYETLGACVGTDQGTGERRRIACSLLRHEEVEEAEEGLGRKYPETALTFKAYDELFPGLMQAVEVWKDGDYTRLPKAMQRSRRTSCSR